MKPKITLALLLCTMTLICRAQSFLSEYPKLTKKNLNEFFVDWKAYSDSIDSNNVIEDSVLADVIKREYAEFWLISDRKPNGITPRYHVFPQIIEVERYYFDVDTTVAKFDFDLAVELAIMKNVQCEIDSSKITPALPHLGVYLTADVDSLLSIFIGGLRNGDQITRINKGNLRKLKKYLPINKGHWGGYWWFTSFPLITDICYANNMIAVMRRTSWWTGDEIWYVKENDKFARRQQPVITWRE